MKLKFSFETFSMDQEIVLVPVGEHADQVQGVLKMNRAGKEIIDLLKQDISEEQIIDFLAGKYENDRDTLTGYVHKTVEVLRKAGLIEESL